MYALPFSLVISAAWINSPFERQLSLGKSEHESPRWYSVMLGKLSYMGLKMYMRDEKEGEEEVVNVSQVSPVPPLARL